MISNVWVVPSCTTELLHPWCRSTIDCIYRHTRRTVSLDNVSWKRNGPRWRHSPAPAAFSGRTLDLPGGRLSPHERNHRRRARPTPLLPDKRRRKMGNCQVGVWEFYSLKRSHLSRFQPNKGRRVTQPTLIYRYCMLRFYVRWPPLWGCRRQSFWFIRSDVFLRVKRQRMTSWRGLQRKWPLLCGMHQCWVGVCTCH